MFLAAVIGYSQQNRRTEFSHAIRELEVTLQDVLNDVGTGYYPNSNNIQCSAGSSGPTIVPDSQKQGTNQDCIFVGRALNLPSASGDSTFEIYTIAGLRNVAGINEPVRTIDEAKPRAISGIPGSEETKTLHGSIDIKKVIVGDGSDPSSDESQGFAVVSGFGGSQLSGSGATTNQVKIASINPGHDFTSETGPTIGLANLDKKITICIEEAGGGRQAAITIGEAFSKLNIQTKIDQSLPGCDTP